MSILGKNFQKFRFWAKCCKILISVKIVENLKFGQIWHKISILVKLVEKFSNWWKTFKNVDFLTKYKKMLIFAKIIKKSLTLVKMFKNLDFGQNLQKSRIWSIFSKNIDFG